MGRLFGTDGIRGRANQHPITIELAMKTGRAVAKLILQQGDHILVIGKDTRESGDMLESAIAAGASSEGVQVQLAGVIPTPGVAFLVRKIKGAGAGVVISASHNPFHDNGIKIFGKGGLKLSDPLQNQMEEWVLNPESMGVPRNSPARVSNIPEGVEQYADFLVTRFPFKKPASPIQIVADASNGAATFVGPLVFRDPGLFKVQWIHAEPNGKNINQGCGSQHTEDLVCAVRAQRADMGIAFDGDADRLIAVDHKGNEITGDRILAICAKFAKENNRLFNNIVVSTIMSNIGLSQALKALDIDHAISDVGDRMVLEKMKAKGSVMGGEDSGHMIFLGDHSTGDGLLTALRLLEVMAATGESLHDLAKIMTVYPQVLMNVEVDASRPDFNKIPGISDAIKTVEDRLADQGRVLVRYSGTQPLLRVMVEGPEEGLTRQCCREICEAIKKYI